MARIRVKLDMVLDVPEGFIPTWNPVAVFDLGLQTALNAEKINGPIYREPGTKCSIDMVRGKARKTSGESGAT